MAVINPQHLIEQAEFLRSAKPASRPRQADLRRAISTAYYAVFHMVLIAAADEFVGKSLREDNRHTLVYRSIDHSNVRRICDEAARQERTAKYRKYLSKSGFEPKIRDFSNTLLRLQSLRHEADYDPSQYFSTVDALFAIYLAESAIKEFSLASTEGKKLFLALLLFPPR